MTIYPGSSKILLLFHQYTQSLIQTADNDDPNLVKYIFAGHLCGLLKIWGAWEEQRGTFFAEVNLKSIKLNKVKALFQHSKISNHE